MGDDPGSDLVARQYDRWRYPSPIEDLHGWLRNNWEWFDPSHAHRILWPDADYRADLDILVAGCGTNQAAVFALTNPDATVVGIDVSQSSLDHQLHLKDRYGLSNLSLHRLPIEEAPALGRSFDLVVSTGVLHHLADPLSGLKALAACARSDAAIALMVYAKHGRIGVEMLASAFQDMGLGQDDTSVAIIRETLELLPENHPVHSYLAITRDLDSDAGLVDTFLNARERSYTVDECLELVACAGLVFQSWLFNAPYHFHGLPACPTGISAAVRALPDARHWSVMERLHPSNACHFFIACRPERSSDTYTIDFSTPAFRDFVPHLRKGCGLSGFRLSRPDWFIDLDATQLPFVGRVDGVRTIREIALSVARDASSTMDLWSDIEQFSRELFRDLWRLDFLAMARRSGRLPGIDGAKDS